MLLKAIIIIVSIYLVITFVMLPIQYRYLIGIKEEQDKNNQSTREYYEQMPIQEEVLHGNTQLNPMFFLANFLAWLILKFQKKI
ncbi:DUF3949 domain-containing protein [Halobacillus salinus]|uniref:DUF3949 domain-containing protein n=1 Tax=Halobacillus salinus TaxID=192814 RepID=A0A4Z0GWQ5_9BACI|nr:DUF3949 domain-containing protein [Halobacillus salinus]TGB02249.1 DUF3949 domain-containing protein [Halobacillus salinus]